MASREETEAFATRTGPAGPLRPNFSPALTMPGRPVPNWSRAMLAAVILGWAACNAGGGSEHAVESRAETGTVPVP
jgi:hypothetical protein